MKEILDQMEEHIAAIRNLQRNFDYHSKHLEKLMLSLNHRCLENDQYDNVETFKNQISPESTTSKT